MSEIWPQADRDGAVIFKQFSDRKLINQSNKSIESQLVAEYYFKYGAPKKESEILNFTTLVNALLYV